MTKQSHERRDCHACVPKLLLARRIDGALRRAGTPFGLAMTMSDGNILNASVLNAYNPIFRTLILEDNVLLRYPSPPLS